MEDDEGRLIIEGMQEDGHKFRPSDWIERIAATLAEFGPDHRLHYSEAIQPCVIDGTKCLLVAQHLHQENPGAFEFIMNFAHTNHLRIVEDRRHQDEPVEEDRRRG